MRTGNIPKTGLNSLASDWATIDETEFGEGNFESTILATSSKVRSFRARAIIWGVLSFELEIKYFIVLNIKNQ